MENNGGSNILPELAVEELGVGPSLAPPVQAASQSLRPAGVGQPESHGGLRANRANNRYPNNLYTKKDWSVPTQVARPLGYGCADRSAGPCIPQPIPQQARLVNNVTPVLVDNILNPQGIWVPAKNINGLEKVPTPKKQLKDWSVPKEQAVPSRVSGRARAPPTFYQAGTNGK